MASAQHRHRSQAWFAVGLLTLAFWAGSGCYTMLRHPDPEEGFAATEDDSCQRCHSTRLEGSYDASSWVDYYTYSSSPWLNYYASPWWYDTEWILTPGSSSGPARDHWQGGGGSSPSGEGGTDGAPARRLTWGRRLMADEPSPHDLMDRTTSSSAPIIVAPNVPSGPGSSVTVSRDSDSGNQEATTEKKEKAGQKGRAIRR